MTVETATYIDELQDNLPADSDVISEGDDHIKLIKSVLQNQFTSLGLSAVTATAAQINSWEARITALEQKTAIEPLPAEAYDFNADWWETPAAEDARRMWGILVNNSSLDNAPWPHGAGGSGQSVITVQKLINNGAAVALNLIWRLNMSDGSSTAYWRQSDRSETLTAAVWQRATWSQQSTQESGNTGRTEFSSVPNELEARCSNFTCVPI